MVLLSSVNFIFEFFIFLTWWSLLQYNAKRKRSFAQVSKKKDCPATIHIQQIAKKFKVGIFVKKGILILAEITYL